MDRGNNKLVIRDNYIVNEFLHILMQQSRPMPKRFNGKRAWKARRKQAH